MVIISWGLLTLMFLLGVVTIVIGAISAMLARFSGWAKSYIRLGKRYGAQIHYSMGKPGLTFNYGSTPCTLKSKYSRITGIQETRLTVRWVNRKLRLFVSSLHDPDGVRMSWNMKPVPIQDLLPQQQHLAIYCNEPDLARQMLTPSTLYQIHQLVQHHGNTGIEIHVRNGIMNVMKPGIIKDYQALDDFVRFALDLFDQFKLAYNKDIQFLESDSAIVVGDVKCPICSDTVQGDMVVCVRCKTPHCQDCWEYNGQCATFACSETRCFPSGSKPSVSGHSG